MQIMLNKFPHFSEDNVGFCIHTAGCWLVTNGNFYYEFEHIQTSELQSGQFWLDFLNENIHVKLPALLLSDCFQQILRIISTFGYLALWKVLNSYS